MRLWYLVYLGLEVGRAMLTATNHQQGSWSNRTSDSRKHSKWKSRKSSSEFFWEFGGWLPPDFQQDPSSVRTSLKSEWRQNGDCLFGQRRNTRPYPNDCYGHSFAKCRNKEEAFKSFWKEIRGDLQFTYDNVLFDGEEMLEYLPNQLWYLIAYLRHMVIKIEDPRKLAGPPKLYNSFNTDTSFNTDINSMIEDFRNHLKVLNEKGLDRLPANKQHKDDCPKDQYLELCPHPCNMRRCDDGIPSPTCPSKAPKHCPPPACVCTDGLYMDKDGKCGKKSICCYILKNKIVQKKLVHGKAATTIAIEEPTTKKISKKEVIDLDILIYV